MYLASGASMWMNALPSLATNQLFVKICPAVTGALVVLVKLEMAGQAA